MIYKNIHPCTLSGALAHLRLLKKWKYMEYRYHHFAKVPLYFRDFLVWILSSRPIFKKATTKNIGPCAFYWHKDYPKMAKKDNIEAFILQKLKHNFFLFSQNIFDRTLTLRFIYKNHTLCTLFGKKSV